MTASSPNIKVYDDVNPDTGTHFYFAMHNPSSAATDDTFTFPISTSDGTYTVPEQGTLAINGQDAKILVADYDMDGQHLVYSTSEIMTHFVQGSQDLALLYGRDGEDGETVLRYTSRPTVTTISGSVASTYDQATGDLRLDYVHNGLAEVQISGGGRPPLTLLLADTTTADAFWRQDTAAGPVLEEGPELVRTATMDGPVLRLTGDTSAATTMRAWAPPRTRAVTWNGMPVALAMSRRRDPGSGVLSARLPGPAPISLPSTARWKYAPEPPEAQPSFDDSSWPLADKTTTNSTTKPPAGQPVLTADDYGFHQGDVWYRASYSGAGAATTLTMNYGGGGSGLLQAWLDGVYLGQNVLASGQSSPPTTGTATFTIPTALRTDGPHTLAVIVRNDGHNEDGGVNDAQKEGRGLISVNMTDANQAVVNSQITWRIQGDLGGEDIADPARGVENNGGLYGERHGWYLPGYPDGDWTTTTVPASTAMSGTEWYRTTFDLRVPRADDASLGITIGDPSTPQSSADYRALIFVAVSQLAGHHPGRRGPGQLRGLGAGELPTGREQWDDRRLLRPERHSEGPRLHQRPAIRFGNQRVWPGRARHERRRAERRRRRPAEHRWRRLRQGSGHERGEQRRDRRPRRLYHVLELRRRRRLGRRQGERHVQRARRRCAGRIDRSHAGRAAGPESHRHHRRCLPAHARRRRRGRRRRARQRRLGRCRAHVLRLTLSTKPVTTS